MVPQLLANGIATSAECALLAVGFGLIYHTSKVFHFAHGATFVVAAYLFYSFYSQLRMGLVLAAVLVILLAGLLGLLIDVLVYRPLDRKGSSALGQLLSSVGCYIVLVNSLPILYDNQSKQVFAGVVPMREFLGVRLTEVQIGGIVFASFVICSVAVVLRVTTLGKLIRALRDDPQLLALTGSDPGLVRSAVFVGGSGLAGAAAVLHSLDVGIEPTIGLPAFLAATVAMIVGGTRSFEAAAFGALLLGVLQNAAVRLMANEWREPATFIIFVLFLLFRPQGLLSSSRRTEEIQ